MKTLVYDNPVDNAEELVARITVATGEIRDMLGVFQNVRISIWRCEMLTVARGRNFELLLCPMYILLFQMYYSNDFSLVVSFLYGAFVYITATGKHCQPRIAL